MDIIIADTPNGYEVRVGTEVVFGPASEVEAEDYALELVYG